MKSGSTTKAYIAQSISRNLLLARGSGIETAKSSTQVSGGSSSSRTKPVPTPDGYVQDVPPHIGTDKMVYVTEKLTWGLFVYK